MVYKAQLKNTQDLGVLSFHLRLLTAVLVKMQVFFGMLRYVVSKQFPICQQSVQIVLKISRVNIKEQESILTATFTSVPHNETIETIKRALY
jgi:hypothetical protein